MARLKQETKDKILAEFHIGKSQNWLATKYECSPATVNKICKGVIPKYKEKVNTVATIKTELNSESEYQSECFDKEVNDLLRRKNLVYGASEKLLQRTQQMIEDNKTFEKVNIGDGVQQFEPRELNSSDYKNLADTIDRSSITLGVNDRFSQSSVQVNQALMQNDSKAITKVEIIEDVKHD